MPVTRTQRARQEIREQVIKVIEEKFLIEPWEHCLIGPTTDQLNTLNSLVDNGYLQLTELDEYADDYEEEGVITFKITRKLKDTLKA
jgi:hypothetical protein